MDGLRRSMRTDNRTLAGILFFLGAAQFLTVMMVGEALYTGYSINSNAISDLGVGSTAVLFNMPVILVGVFGIAGAYLFHRTHGKKIFTLLLLLSGIGAIIVGLFPRIAAHPIWSARSWHSSSVVSRQSSRILWRTLLCGTAPPVSRLSVSCP